MRVVLVEDHRLEQEALCSALGTAGVQVVGQASAADAALSLVDAEAPDVAVIDLRLSDAPDAREDEGLYVAKAIRDRRPEVGLLVLSAYAQAAYAQRLLTLAGSRSAVGYLLKGGPGGLAELIDAIERVARGEVVIDPVIIRRLIDRPRPGEHPISTLSPQEHRVLELIAQGRSNLRIAQELRCRISTVEKHASSIFSKLNLTDGTEDDRRDYNARVMAALVFLRSSRSTRPQAR